MYASVKEDLAEIGIYGEKKHEFVSELLNNVLGIQEFPEQGFHEDEDCEQEGENEYDALEKMSSKKKLVLGATGAGAAAVVVVGGVFYAKKNDGCIVV